MAKKKTEEVVEKATEDNVVKVDLSKKQVSEDDGIIKVNLDKPPTPKEDEVKALAVLRNAETETGEYSIFDSHLPNYTVNR